MRFQFNPSNLTLTTTQPQPSFSHIKKKEKLFSTFLVLALHSCIIPLLVKHVHVANYIIAKNFLNAVFSNCLILKDQKLCMKFLNVMFVSFFPFYTTSSTSIVRRRKKEKKEGALSCNAPPTLARLQGVAILIKFLLYRTVFMLCYVMLCLIRNDIEKEIDGNI